MPVILLTDPLMAGTGREQKRSPIPARIISQSDLDLHHLFEIFKIFILIFKNLLDMRKQKTRSHVVEIGYMKLKLYYCLISSGIKLNFVLSNFILNILVCG